MTLATPITPHLWFATQAHEAAKFYCAVFPDSRITQLTRLHDTPSGDCDVLSFELCGQPFMAISAGPLFEFTPAVSFFVNFEPGRDAGAGGRLDALWAALVDGGKVLMELGEYPFSPRYGWLQDRYGVSWQLILNDPADEARPPIEPCLLFTDAAYGQAQAAGEFYRSVFAGSREGQFMRYPDGMPPNRAGTVMFSDMRLGPTWFALMDGAGEHGFAFNEAISFMVICRDQAELDHYWAALSADPKSEQCGWCKDRFGVSWQVAPKVLGELMASSDPAVIARVTAAFLQMKKFDVAKIEAAGRG